MILNVAVAAFIAVMAFNLHSQIGPAGTFFLGLSCGTYLMAAAIRAGLRRWLI